MKPSSFSVAAIFFRVLLNLIYVFSPFQREDDTPADNFLFLFFVDPILSVKKTSQRNRNTRKTSGKKFNLIILLFPLGAW